MVANLVEKLGEEASDGRRAFPTAKAMASVPAEFYRDEIGPAIARLILPSLPQR